jgi:hypothetical protein
MNSENGNFFSVAKKNEAEKNVSQKSETVAVITEASQCQRKRECVTEPTSPESPKRSKLCHALSNPYHFEALNDHLLLQMNKKSQINLVHLLMQTGFLQPRGPGSNVKSPKT